MSDNILQAIDNIEAALSGLDLADGVGTAHETLQSINNNIDAIRLAVEIRSVAEVTAQNTNFTDLIAALGSLTLSLNVSGGCCCGGAGNQTIFTPDDITLVCQPPEGFSSWNEYLVYKCKAVNMVIDHLVTSLNGLAFYYQWFTDNHGWGGGFYLNQIATYNRISQFFPSMLPDPIETNLTPSQASAIKQEMNDRYTNFHRENVDNDWSTFTQEILEFFTNVYGTVRDRIDTDNETLKQGIFDLSSTTDVFDLLDARLTSDFQYVRDTYPFAANWVDEAETTAKTLLTNGFLNLLFLASGYAEGHTPQYSCTGLGGCACDGIEHIISGTSPDGDNWTSELTGGYHQVDFIVNATGPALPDDICGDQRQVAVANLVGQTTPGDGEGFIIYNDAGTEVYNGSDPWGGSTCSRRFRVRSTTPFTVTLAPGTCS